MARLLKNGERGAEFLYLEIKMPNAHPNNRPDQQAPKMTRAQRRAAQNHSAGPAASQIYAAPDLMQDLALADLPVNERVARISAALTRRVETILADIDAGRSLQGAQIGAIKDLTALTNKLAEMARESTPVPKRDPEQLTAALWKIDNRINFLAHELARNLAVEAFGLDPEAVEAALPLPLEGGHNAYQAQ